MYAEALRDESYVALSLIERSTHGKIDAVGGLGFPAIEPAGDLGLTWY